MHRVTLVLSCVLSLAVSKTAVSQPCVELQHGLVAWWSGDEEGDGGSAVDELGRNNGTLVGATVDEDGEVGGAFSFNGVSDSIAVPSSADFDLTGDFTIEARVYLSDVVNGRIYPIIMRGLCVSDQIPRYADWLWYLHQGQMRFFRFDDVRGETDVGVGFAPSAGAWYHVAVARSGDDLLFYADGTLLGTRDVAGVDYGPVDEDDPLDVTIGREEGEADCSGKDRWWDGKLDEIKLFQRALSRDEIFGGLNAGGTCKEDTDHDGFIDAVDHCPHSDTSSTVVIDGTDTGVQNVAVGDGCTISDLIAAAIASDPSGAEVLQLLVDLDDADVITTGELMILADALGLPLPIDPFADVTPSVEVRFSRARFNRRTRQQIYQLKVKNLSPHTFGPPLVLVVSSISRRCVSVANPSGITTSGDPYFDLSQVIGGDGLTPGETSGCLTVVFHNPRRVRFRLEVAALSPRG